MSDHVDLKRRFGLIALMLVLAVVVPASVSCSDHDGGWLDDGISFLCPVCRNQPVYLNLGTCRRCGTTTSSGSYRLCYECAKELRRCQACGIEMFP